VTGQVALSGTAQACSATVVTGNGWVIKAPATNAHNAYIGPAGVTTSTGHVLCPGDEFPYERRDQVGAPTFDLRVSDFYAVGTSGDVVTWLASP
jgi:hypothetical protein